MNKCYITISDENSEQFQYARRIVQTRLADRGITPGEGGLVLHLITDPAAPEDSYRITGGDDHITVTADTVINILAGCGAFLRDSSFDENGITPGKRRGLTVPDCSFRGIYLANHFHNYFMTSSTEEMTRYLEDMALWGFNILKIGFPEINLDYFGSAMFYEEMDRITPLMLAAQKLGIRNMVPLYSGQTGTQFPEEYRATPVPDPLNRHGNFGNILCMSNPDAFAFCLRDNEILLSEYKKRGIDVYYANTWPYDEGGCGCEKCSPWGANGYLRISKALAKLFKEYYPEGKLVVATWTFDTPCIGEWEALSKSLAEEKWADIVLADAHTDYPRYPLDVEVPGNLPLISFPEISMWGLYPWGGHGAVGFPWRMTNIWQQTQGKLMGELLYSEGIYEDLNKITVAGLCEDFNRDPAETLRQYAKYELGLNDTDKFVRMIYLMEYNHVAGADKNRQCDLAMAEEAYNLSRQIDTVLPSWGKTCWRWRIIYLRILLDLHRYRGQTLGDDPVTLAAMHEIIDIFHCLPKWDGIDWYHQRVRPACPEF